MVISIIVNTTTKMILVFLKADWENNFFFIRLSFWCYKFQMLQNKQNLEESTDFNDGL